jgi:hypothetical protein
MDIYIVKVRIEDRSGDGVPLFHSFLFDEYEEAAIFRIMAENRSHVIVLDHDDQTTITTASKAMQELDALVDSLR